MKRYVKCNYTFMEVLDNPEGREIVETIEDCQSEINSRNVDYSDTSEFYVRLYNDKVAELKSKFGYDWK